MRCVRAAVAAALFVSPALAQDTVFPEGSRFGLIPFPGSVPGDGFTGFGNPQTYESVVIIEMPVEAYDEVAAGLRDAAKLAEQGVAVEAVEEIDVGGRPAVRVRGTQKAQGLTFPKCIVALKGRGATGLFSAQMPGAEGGDACDLITGIGEREDPGQASQVAALPFALDDMAGMRVVRTLAGNGVLLTRGAADTLDKGPDQPLMIVVRSLGAVLPGADGREAFATKALASLDDYADQQIVSSSPVEVAGLPGVEHVVDAVSAPDGRRVRLAHTVLFDDAEEAYYRLVGISPEAAWEENAATFAAVRAGFRPR